MLLKVNFYYYYYYYIVLFIHLTLFVSLLFTVFFFFFFFFSSFSHFSSLLNFRNCSRSEWRVTALVGDFRISWGRKWDESCTSLSQALHRFVKNIQFIMIVNCFFFIWFDLIWCGLVWFSLVWYILSYHFYMILLPCILLLLCSFFFVDAIEFPYVGTIESSVIIMIVII